VSALSFLYSIEKSHPADALIIAEFAINDIKDIEWHPKAFDRLQMPERKKKAIRSLAKAHIRRASTNSFNDFIVGKG
jgi:hypothetical protein